MVDRVAITPRRTSTRGRVVELSTRQLGYAIRTPSTATLFILGDGVVYFGFHYGKGEMTTADVKMLIDINTPDLERASRALSDSGPSILRGLVLGKIGL
jgi:hypothetical protein